MTLPSGIGGNVTRTVGYFERPANDLADWLKTELAPATDPKPAGWESLASAVRDFASSSELVLRHAVIPVADWSMMLTDGPLGTDVGMLPSLAARELGCRAIRATCVEDDEPGYPGRVLELFGPDGEPPLLHVRSIAAVNDGGRWTFDDVGEPLAFERLDHYKRRRKRDRFTSGLLYEYLRALGVPIDTEPAWERSLVVELA